MFQASSPQHQSPPPSSPLQNSTTQTYSLSSFFQFLCAFFRGRVLLVGLGCSTYSSPTATSSKSIIVAFKRSFLIWIWARWLVFGFIIRKENHPFSFGFLQLNIPPLNFEKCSRVRLCSGIRIGLISFGDLLFLK